MITLTAPYLVNSVLGGTEQVTYNKLVVGPFTMDAVSQTVQATLRITSTAVPTMPAILGQLRISLPGGNECVIEVGEVGFRRRFVLSSAQATALLAHIEAAQDALERAMVTFGMVSGVRSQGA